MLYSKFLCLIIMDFLFLWQNSYLTRLYMYTSILHMYICGTLWRSTRNKKSRIRQIENGRKYCDHCFIKNQFVVQQKALTAHSSISILQVYLSHTWLNFKYTSSILDTSILRQDCLKYTWSILGSSILLQVFFKYTSSLLGQVRTSPSILQVYLKLSWRNK